MKRAFDHFIDDVISAWHAIVFLWRDFWGLWVEDKKLFCLVLLAISATLQAITELIEIFSSKL